MRFKKKFYIPFIALIIAGILFGVNQYFAIPVSANNQYLAVGNNIVQPNLSISSSVANNYDLQVGSNVIHIGNPNHTTTFSPTVNFPCWQDYSWNTQIGLTMAVTANALATAGMTTTSTSTSVTASNSYFNITYSGVNVNPPFNETGGMDISITLKKSVGNALSFGYNNTNVNAYLQPSLTKEWTIGQTLLNGNTVASVTDTDVTDNLGNNVAHRPIYVVNGIVFYSSVGGGVVTDTQASTGLTTGQIGILYRMNLTGANGKTGYGDWSINGSNLILTFDTTGMIYPITIAPAGDTFGYTTLGSSSTNNIAANYPVVDNYSTSFSNSNSVMTSISIGANISSGSCAIIGALYNNTTYITNSGTSVMTVNNSTINWYTGTASATITTGTYINLSCMGDATWKSSGKWAYNSGTNQCLYKSGQTACYPTWPDPYGFNSAFMSNISASIYCTYTTYAISNTPSTKDFGVVSPSSTYYAYGSAPSNPVTDAKCTYTLTNSGSTAKINVHGANATGGVGWTLTSGTPGANAYRCTVYTSGMDPASGVILTTSDQTLIASMAAGTKKWDFKEETGSSFTDGAQKTYVITLSAVAP